MKRNPTYWLHIENCNFLHSWVCFCVLKCFQEFARRALGKINDLAELEQQSGVPATRETQSAFKEASIKASDSSLQNIPSIY